MADETLSSSDNKQISTSTANWNSNQLRKYDIDLKQIPRLNKGDSCIDDLIADNKPVVILNSNIVKSAEKWDLDYMEKFMGPGDCTVFLSKTHRFKYYDDKKISKLSNFVRNMRKVDMKLSEFICRLKSWKPGNEYLYLQQALNSTLGEQMVRDFLQFDWHYCNSKQQKHNWGPLTSNLLLVSQEGNVTPCHYDEQENLFAQIRGRKRCILFSPSYFECLYPHPVHHPHDRQSMVDFEHPDYERFPKLKKLEGYETVLEPGDVLYIPIYWWHHIESLLKGGPTVTINFWYKGGPSGDVLYPLKDHQKVAIMRNVEKMLLSVLQEPAEVGPLLNTMVSGRFDESVS